MRTQALNHSTTQPPNHSRVQPIKCSSNRSISTDTSQNNTRTQHRHMWKWGATGKGWAHRDVTPPRKHTRRRTFILACAFMVQDPRVVCRQCAHDNRRAWYLQMYLLGFVRVHDTRCASNVCRAHPEADAVPVQLARHDRT